MTDLETKLYEYSSQLREDEDRDLIRQGVHALVRMRIHLERYADHGGSVAEWRDEARKVLRELGGEA